MVRAHFLYDDEFLQGSGIAANNSHANWVCAPGEPEKLVFPRRVQLLLLPFRQGVNQFIFPAGFWVVLVEGLANVSRNPVHVVVDKQFR